MSVSGATRVAKPRPKSTWRNNRTKGLKKTTTHAIEWTDKHTRPCMNSAHKMTQRYAKDTGKKNDEVGIEKMQAAVCQANDLQVELHQSLWTNPKAQRMCNIVAICSHCIAGLSTMFHPQSFRELVDARAKHLEFRASEIHLRLGLVAKVDRLPPFKNVPIEIWTKRQTRSKLSSLFHIVPWMARGLSTFEHWLVGMVPIKLKKRNMPSGNILALCKLSVDFSGCVPVPNLMAKCKSHTGLFEILYKQSRHE